MPFIEINGKKIEAEAGSMIIEVADCSNIQIPRFCYHKKLSIAASCRMCLVEVERAPKPLPACATPVTEGMKVWTRSPKALLAQKAVMEFLLINHPLDCPICDQGGECELQDLSMGYGQDASRYTEGKRVVKDKNIGSLIATDLTRCIQCTRCVRFGTEVAGIRELGATGRGECLEIGTFIEQSVSSELSGNMIDLCPVGALTSKPYRFTARGWELKQTPSIAPHDCVGSHIYVHTRRNQVMRVVPRENESINEAWVSDRDRFSYEALYHSDRLTQPKIKLKGEWQTVSWQIALEYIANRLSQIGSQHGANAIGALLSPNATLEEGYLLQKWMRGLGSHSIDHRLRQSDFRHQEGAPLFPGLGLPINELEQQSLVLLVGSDIRKEQPIIGLKLRKMALAGGKALVVNPVDVPFNFDIALKSIVCQGNLVLGLAKIAKALLNQSEIHFAKEAAWLASIEPEAVDIQMANLLRASGKKMIVMGALAASHPAFSQIKALTQLISELSGAKVGILTDGSNSAGAWLSGCIPHRLPGGKSVQGEAGFTIAEMFEKALKAYVLVNVEPHLDCIEGAKARRALEQAEFVVAINTFESPSLQKAVDVWLPLAPFSETSGTLVNTEGQWQSFVAVANPFEESRPGWKILRVLGNVCDIPDFDYETCEDVLAALRLEIGTPELTVIKPFCVDPIEYLANTDEIIRIAPIPLYASDGLVRRAPALQQTKDAGFRGLQINRTLATRLNLVGEAVRVQCEDCVMQLPLLIDEQMPDNTAMIFSGLEDTVSLGGPYSVLKLENI